VLNSYVQSRNVAYNNQLNPASTAGFLLKEIRSFSRRQTPIWSLFFPHAAGGIAAKEFYTYIWVTGEML